MELLSQVWEWFAQPDRWTGSGIDPGIFSRLAEHMSMSLQAAGLAAAVMLPLGLYIGHTRRFGFLALQVGNFGRALPSFGILGISFSLTIGFRGTLGFWATFIALFLLAIPPILTNTYVGIKGVDPDVVESARGMGMTEREVMLKVEVPLAAPLIVSGLRLATVQVVATATLGALVAWGGLGRYIVDGFAAGDDVQLLAGAILVAVVAILTEVAFGVVESLVSPRVASEDRAPLTRFARGPVQPAGSS